MLPTVVTDAAIAIELPGARAWAERHNIAIDTRRCAERIVRVVLVQEEDDEMFYLQGVFENYKELPPVWDWRDESWSTNEGRHLSPRPEHTPFGASMFLQHGSKGIICAPFNRMAYGTLDGPHSDWGNPAQWMTAGPDYVYAVTIGDMLQSIVRDFKFTRGRMG